MEFMFEVEGRRSAGETRSVGAEVRLGVDIIPEDLGML